jgi:hypothetical protein
MPDRVARAAASVEIGAVSTGIAAAIGVATAEVGRTGSTGAVAAIDLIAVATDSTGVEVAGAIARSRGTGAAIPTAGAGHRTGRTSIAARVRIAAALASGHHASTGTTVAHAAGARTGLASPPATTAIASRLFVS